MSDIFQFNKDLGYKERKSKLIDNKVALWDVIHTCKREGSLDKNIEDIEVNDIVGFIKDNPSITTIILNGGKARDIYTKHFKDQLVGIKAITLYSTSPANAIKYEKKLEQWSVIKEIIEG
jgi:TDG/mug DNA glycosylase family protein